MQTVSLSRASLAPLTTRKSSSATARRARVAANASADRPLWFPGAAAPGYLAGLPGDRGFDPAVCSFFFPYLSLFCVKLDLLFKIFLSMQKGDVETLKCGIARGPYEAERK